MSVQIQDDRPFSSSITESVTKLCQTFETSKQVIFTPIVASALGTSL